MSFMFKAVADRVIRGLEKSPATLTQCRTLLGRLEPLHKKHVAQIEAHDVWQAVKAIQDAGHRQTAQRALRLVSLVLRHAIAERQRTASDCTRDLAGLLKPGRSTPRAAVTTEEGVREVLKALYSGRGEPTTQAANKLLPHLFVRKNELLGMRWSEIDWGKKLWVIPAERMKMRLPHAVPLSRQAEEMIEAQRFEDEVLVFPGRDGREMSHRTLNDAMARSGVPPEKHVPHGWRTTASTLMGEWGWDRNLVELQLSHVKRDRIQGIYDRSQRLEERRELMQKWSDWLDEVMK